MQLGSSHRNRDLGRFLPFDSLSFTSFKLDEDGGLLDVDATGLSAETGEDFLATTLLGLSLLAALLDPDAHKANPSTAELSKSV